VSPLAKIDDVIDRLEELNREILKIKTGIVRLSPLPPTVKAPVVRGAEALDPILAELYFDALRGGVDLARDPRVQESSLKAIQSATRPRSRAQKRNDKMQSQAFVRANAKLRTKSGALRKGITQSDVAKRAQKELKLMKRGKGKAGGRPSPSSGMKKRKSPARSGGGRR